MKQRKRIILEPELEAFAGKWGVLTCLEAARKFGRWQKQLEMKAHILVKSADDDPPSFSSKARRVRRALQCPRAKQN